MKKTKIIFWICTILFGAFMVSTAIPNITMSPDSIALISTGLGYPEYIIPFLGWAKIFGVLGIVVRKFPRITEWSYAGLFFDITGAMYSGVATGGFDPMMLTMIVPYGLMAVSYIYHHKLLAAEQNVAVV